MTRAQAIRHEVLLQLYASGRVPLGLTHILKVSRGEQFDFGESEIRDAVYFLRGQACAEPVLDPATGEVKYRITSRGMLEFENKDER